MDEYFPMALFFLPYLPAKIRSTVLLVSVLAAFVRPGESMA
jgi:hypothetical protein